MAKTRGTELVAFFHVPRTGGTSFLQYANKVVGKDKTLVIYGNLIPKAREVVGGVRDWGKYRFMRGHVTTACVDSVPSYAVLVTFLRNPVDRVNSLYKYIRRDPNHPIYKLVTRMTLEDFVRSGVSLEVDNGMVRQLCGSEPELLQVAYDSQAHSPPHTPLGLLGRDKLDEAIGVLSKFGVVGTTEHMDLTYTRLWEQVKWGRAAIPWANKTVPMDPTPTERSLIHEHNQLDEELWRWATRRLIEESRW